MSSLTLPPLSLYVHIPWCVRKCPYCDFNSHEYQVIPEAEYLESLIQDLKSERLSAQGRKLTSIFFGGGTPSLFSAASIATILDVARDVFGFHENIEITLEANPGTAEQDKFSGFYQAGVNRLSIGVQSFQSRHLEKLGRIHSSSEAESAVAMARKAGFSNINLDLMHGLPDQSLDEAMDDLRKAISLNPEHISWYQLTIEPNTEFYSAPPVLPQDEILADIQQAGQSVLSDYGYDQYEVSAYSKNNKQAKHNLNYWQFGDYIGIGAGAHGKLTDVSSQSIYRRQKARLPANYMKKEIISLAKNQLIDADSLPLEFMMNALRLKSGVNKTVFFNRTGLPYSVIEDTVLRLQNKSLMQINDECLSTTEQGFLFLNSVLDEFMA